MQSASAAFGTIVAGNEMVVEHAVTINLPLFKKNLASTPSFENGLGKWQMSGSASVISPSTSHALIGIESMRVDWATMSSFSGGPQLSIPDAKPGKTYAVALKVWIDTGGPSVTLVNVDSGNTVSTKGSWQLLWGLITPSDYSSSIWIMPTTNVTAGANVGMWVDTVLWWESATIPTGTEYFDGDSPSGVWLGLPGLSESIVYTDPFPSPSAAVQSIRISRSLATDAPAATRLISGYATATATVVLSGIVGTDESQDAAWLFGADETTSPIWGTSPDGSPIVIQQGLYTSTAQELITTFTGFVDDVLVDNVSREVTVIALDPMTKFRPSVTIPPVAAIDNVARNNPGVTAAWALEYLARQNGYNPNPPPRTAVMLYASMHGSAWPEVYDPTPTWASGMRVNQSMDLFGAAAPFTGTPQDFLATLTGGVWSPQVVRNPSLIGVPTLNPQFNGGNIGFDANSHSFFEGWLTPDNTQDSSATTSSYWGVNTVTHGNYLRVAWTWAPGAATAVPTLLIQRDAGSTTKPLTGSMTTNVPHQVSCFVLMTGSTTATVTLIVDGTTFTTLVTGLPAAGGFVNILTADFVWVGFADTIQITNERYPIPTSGSFTQTAVIDPTLNPLTAIPDTTGQAAKDVVQAIAAAELGVAGFDELGTLRFRNRNTIFASSSSRVVSASSSLKGFQSDDGMAAVATHIQVTATPLSLVPAVVWSATEVIKVPRLSTYTAIVQTSVAAVTPQAPDSGYVATSGGGPPGTTYWRAARQPNGLTAISGGIVVQTYSLSSTTLALSIANSNAYDVYMVSPQSLSDVTPGTPYVFIGGRSLTSLNAGIGDSQWPDISDGGSASNTQYGDIALQIPQHPWMQDTVAAQGLADDILPDTYKPKPLLTNVSIVADPRLQLADRLTFSDPDGSKMIDDVLLFGSDFTDSKTDWTMQINAVRVAPPGDWIMGQAGRSEMGHSTFV